MKRKKLMVVLLSAAMSVGLAACGGSPADSAASEATGTEVSSTVSSANTEATSAISGTEASAASASDVENFKIDASKIPQEKLDTTLYVAVSVRGLENPYIATIADGMDMFCDYLDSIGQKYEKQVLDSGGSNDVEIDNMKQFAAKAGGNAIAYADPNESAIAPSLAEAMA